MTYSKEFAFYGPPTIEPPEVAPSANLRRGITWLLKHRFTVSDDKAMVDEIERCWYENRLSVTLGLPVVYDKRTCDICPSLILCRQIYDQKCPDSTIEIKIRRRS